LLVVNLTLVAFNMLPAFPLDGGRVFRALMATVLPYATATRFAATVGQACAIGLGYLGLANPLLLVIAVFIFFAAAAEARQATLLERIGDYRVRDGMIRSFHALPSDASIGDIGPELLDSYQRDFPVIQDGMPVGMLSRDELLRAIGQGGNSLIADVMQTDVPSVEESDGLVVAFERASPAGGGTLPVTEGGSLTGLLDLQQVVDLANLRTRLRRTTSYMPTLLPQQPAGGTTT
jgi:CBS domain-containing protein